MSDGNNPHNPGQVYIDPHTGQPTDPATGQPVAQPNAAVDPTTGQPVAATPQIDPGTGQPVAPAAAPQDQRPLPPEQNQAFGFNEAPVQEKYNTEYIVKNLHKEQRTTQYLVIGVVVAALAGAALWLLLKPEAELPPTPAAATAPAESADAEATDDAAAAAGDDEDDTDSSDE